MNLLHKVKSKLNKKSGPEEHVKVLNKLPDKEKVKVLDYLKTVKALHKHEQ